jgi:hypothetical protein
MNFSHMHTSYSKYSIDGRPLELRLGTSLLRGSHMMWVLILALSVPLVSLLGIVFMVAAKKGESTGIADVLASLWSSMGKNFELDWQLWILVILAPLGVIFLMMQRLAYLRLSSYGMEGYVPKWMGLGFSGLSTGRWRIPWEAIRTVRLLPGKMIGKPAMDLRGYRLVIETDPGQTRLSPFSWLLRGGPDHRLTFREALPSKKSEVAELIERAPLIQVLRMRSIEISTDEIVPEKESTGYDLAKHPGLVVQLVLFFVAGLYALIDAFIINPFKVLEPLPTEPFVVVGLVGVVLAFVLGKGAPIMERSIIGVMMAATLMAAVYPGLLRLNAMTAEPKEIRYRAVGTGQFVSTTPNLPALDLRSLDVNEYWSQYPDGTDHEFVLLRGAGGFYQVDLQPLYDRTRDYYSGKDRGR